MAAAAEEVVAEGSSVEKVKSPSPLELEFLEVVEAEEMGGRRGCAWEPERERRWELGLRLEGGVEEEEEETRFF